MILLNTLPETENLSLKIIEWGVSGFFTMISILGAAYLAYRFALKQIRKETTLLIEREKYTRVLNALQECWKLLAYTTDTENEKTIITFVNDKETKKKYFGNLKNCREYIVNLSQYFYGSGSGLYLPSELRRLLFEYRSIVYGFLLSCKEKKSDTMEIQNTEMVSRMLKIHQSVVELLRVELNLKTPTLQTKKQ